MRRGCIVVALLWSTTVAAATATLGARPEEAIDADRVAAQSEVADLERRMRSLEEQQSLRKLALKQRVRALYKMSRGGYVRLMFDADGNPDLLRRQAVVRRVMNRDLEELAALADEGRQISKEQSARTEKIAAALDLERQYARVEDHAASGFAAKKGRLERPVSGAIVGAFGQHRDPDLKLDLVRRGVELSARSGQTVRAVSPGRVVWVGKIRGTGTTVAIDHGEGFVSLTSRLGAVAVQLGQGVEAGTPLGEADSRRVYFELAEQRTPLDPAAWLSRH